MAETIFKQEIDETTNNLILVQPQYEKQYCRLCLTSDDTEFKQLFSPFNPTQSIVEVIEEFAKVAISQNDQYSKLICCNCLVKLRESENFKLLIETCDLKLRKQETNVEDPLDSDDSVNGESDHEKIDIDEIDIEKQLICSEIEQNQENENIRSVNIEEIKIENDGRELKQNENENGMKELEKTLKIKKRRSRKPNLACPECGKVFKWHSDLNRHIPSHTGLYPFHCSSCNKEFISKYHLQKHELTHTGERKHQCEICGKGFRTPSLFLRHRNTHDGLKPYKCDECNKEFTRKESLSMHIANLHSLKTDQSNFTCNICNRQYKTRFHFKKHMQQTHNPREVGTCNICGKFVRQLTVHTKSHFKLYKCTVCNKGFGTANGLKIHSVVHTGQRLYECDVCKKKFGFKQSLRTHKKTHDTDKRFKCEFCAKQFNHKISWKLHLANKHQFIELSLVDS